MATKEKKSGATATTAKSGGKGSGDRKSMLPKGPHAGAALPIPVPRLRAYYRATVRGRLMAQFSLANIHQVPGMEKIVLNVGMG